MSDFLLKTIARAYLGNYFWVVVIKLQTHFNLKNHLASPSYDSNLVPLIIDFLAFYAQLSCLLSIQEYLIHLKN